MSICIQYLAWHFIDMPKGILKGWKNFLVFNLNYFSVPVLLETFFSYWHGYRYSYGKHFMPTRYFEAFVFNAFSRIIGIILRIFLIFLGLLIEIPIFFIGLIVFLGWFILPFLLIAGFFLGLGMMI